MSLLDKVKSLFGGSQSAPSDTAATSEPTIGNTHDEHDHDHAHDGHEHSHEPAGDAPVEPTQN